MIRWPIWFWFLLPNNQPQCDVNKTSDWRSRRFNPARPASITPLINPPLCQI